MIDNHGFFRTVWRINAILILLVAAVVGFFVLTALVTELGGGAKRRHAGLAPELGAVQGGKSLVLGGVALVPGTAVLRGELQVYRQGSGFSSGSSSYAETRNILFIDEGTSVGRWLLSDHDRVVVERRDVGRGCRDKTDQPPVATLALVKAAEADRVVVEGELLLLRPSGEEFQVVADGVRELHTAAVQGSDLILLFERRRRYVRAVFDVETLSKRDEREIEVPQL